MSFLDFLSSRHVFYKLRVANKDALLRELADRAASPAALPADTIRQALLRREQLGSTGVGSGIAIPHARLPGLMQPIGFFARLERPIDFEAIDGHPVDLVFLLLTSESAVSNLPQLAVIARTLRDPQRADAIRKAKDAAAILLSLGAGVS